MINLYIVDYHTRFKTNGIVTYRNQLEKKLIENAEISLNYIWVECKSYADFKREEINGITQYYLPGSIDQRNNPNNFDVKAAEFLKQHLHEIENLIIHFQWVNHCSFGYILKKVINCKTILTQHCTPWRTLIANNYPIFKGINTVLTSNSKDLIILPENLLIELFNYLAMDHIICISEIGRRSLIDLLKFPEEKISLIYNGLDIPTTEDRLIQKNKYRSQYRIGQEEVVLLFTGSLTKAKGTYDLVDAFEKLMSEYSEYDFRLIIAGNGDFQQLHGKMRNSRFKVNMIGHVSTEELYEVIKLADIGIVPSYAEPFGYSALEMMYLGLPVIATDSDGLKELVLTNHGTKLKLTLQDTSAYIDPNEIVEKIKYVLQNPIHTKKMAEDALLYAKDNFSAQRMAESTVNTYKSIVHSNLDNAFKNISLASSPLVSILLYCTDEHLIFFEECLASVLNQTYDNFELLIFYSSSQSAIENYIPDVKDHRIAFKKSIGESKIDTINNGIQSSKGKYFCRIDSSEVLREDRIYKQVDFLEKQENRNIAIVGSNHFVINEKGLFIGLKQYPETDDDIKHLHLFHPPFYSSSTMCRSKILKQYKYTDRYDLIEDYELWYRLSQSHQFANIQDFLTSKRIVNSEMGHSAIKRKEQNIVEFLSEQLDDLEILHDTSELAIHTAVIFRLGKSFFKNEQKIRQLNTWVNKVLAALKSKNGTSDAHIERFRNLIVNNLVTYV